MPNNDDSLGKMEKEEFVKRIHAIVPDATIPWIEMIYNIVTKAKLVVFDETFRKQLSDFLRFAPIDVVNELRERKPEHLRGVQTAREQEYFESGFSYAIGKVQDYFREKGLLEDSNK